MNLWIKEYQCDVRLNHATQLVLSEYNIETRHQILFDKTLDDHKPILYHTFQETLEKI